MDMAIVSNLLNPRPKLLALLLCLPTLALAGSTAVGNVQLLVHPGDTLSGISQRYLDRPSRWPALKALNRVDDELHLVPGSQLIFPAGWLRWTSGSAEVIHVQGEAKTGEGALLISGQRLKEGTRIATGDGIVTLRLAGGATVVFPPGTKARLGLLKEVTGTPLGNTAIDLDSGSAESRVPSLKQSPSRYEIRTPRVVTAVRGTQFRVAAEGDASRHEVVAGLVQVDGRRSHASLKPGQGLRAEEGKVGHPVALLAAPNLSALPSRIERTVQRLAIPPQTGATAWRWQVADDVEFTHLFKDAKTAKPEWLLLGLPDGDYYLRLRAVAADGLEGLDAVAPLALRARPEPPLLRAPSAGAPAAGTPVLSWTLAEDAARVHLQLAQDAGFRDLLLDRSDLTTARLSLDAPLAPGEYFWRMASFRADGYQGPYGDSASFRQLAPTEMAPPALDKDGLTLAWSGPAELHYEVQMAKDVGFENDRQSFTTEGTHLTLPKPSAGTYHVRTRPLLEGAEETPWSAVQRFEVPGSGAWWLLLVLPLL